MELNLKINFNQLIAAIKELSPKDFLKLKKELAHISPSQKQPAKNLKDILDRGPVMSDDQYAQFQENRKKFNEWRTN